MEQNRKVEIPRRQEHTRIQTDLQKKIDVIKLQIWSKMLTLPAHLIAEYDCF